MFAVVNDVHRQSSPIGTGIDALQSSRDNNGDESFPRVFVRQSTAQSQATKDLKSIALHKEIVNHGSWLQV